MAMKGNELYRLFIELSGLDEQNAEVELESLMKRLNLEAECVTTDDLRRLMAVYLEKFDSEMSSTILMNSMVNLYGNKAEA